MLDLGAAPGETRKPSLSAEGLRGCHAQILPGTHHAAPRTLMRQAGPRPTSSGRPTSIRGRVWDPVGEEGKSELPAPRKGKQPGQVVGWAGQQVLLEASHLGRKDIGLDTRLSGGPDTLCTQHMGSLRYTVYFQCSAPTDQHSAQRAPSPLSPQMPACPGELCDGEGASEH